MSKKQPEWTAKMLGFIHMVVCTTLTDVGEIIQRLNREWPTGTSGGTWILTSIEDLQELVVDATSNPMPCLDCPETHRHYVFNC